MSSGGFYSLKEKSATGKTIDFSKEFSGKVVYGVNVASRWGATGRGYQLLSKLASTDGVAVALFPCGQFGGQELANDADIVQFAKGKLGVSSTDGPDAYVFTKQDINGPNACETYKTVKAESGMGDPGWNFKGNFVVDKTGKIQAVGDMGKVEDIVRGLL